MRRFSVIIPSYNHARFVSEAIRSAAFQDYPELELVVVDDGSTDNSPEVIQKTLDDVPLSRTVYLEQPNAGVHVAIARGVEAATGDVLTLLNSDDRFAAQRITKMARELPEAGDFLAFSLVRMIDATGMEFSPDAAPVMGYRHALYEATRCPTVGFALLRNNFAVTSGNLIFTRDHYERLGGFADFVLASDWDFLLRSLFYLEPIFVPQPLLDYRTHGENTRLRVEHVAPDEGRRILNRYLRRCTEANPENRLAPCERNWPFYFDLFTSRYHAWFGRGPIGAWIEKNGSAPQRSDGWRSWAEAVDFERVDDCDYLVDQSADAAYRVAAAIARDVLISEAHPLECEEGPGPDALALAFDRQVRRRPRFQRFPWRLTLDRRTAPLPPGTPRWRRWQKRLLHAARVLEIAPLQWLARAWWLARDRRLLRASELFDAAYYRSHCSEKLGLRRDPVFHYLRRGAKLGLDPHPLFRTSYYREANPDVAASGINPLVHFLIFGGAEHRNPNPFFDCRFYLETHPDVARSGMNPLLHYVRYGAEEGRMPHPRFDGQFYSETWCDDGNPLSHYLEHGRTLGAATNLRQEPRLQLERSDRVEGKAEELAWSDRAGDRAVGRQFHASGFFDPDFYEVCAGSDFETGADPLRHFLERGASEGIRFCPPDALNERLMELDVGNLDQPALRYLKPAKSVPSPAPGRRVVLYASSLGNMFFREMVELLAHGFRRAGADVFVRTEAEEPDVAAHHSIVVAPHEFFLLGEGPLRLSREFLSRSHLWLAEQPGSEFSAMCLWFARFARGILDINPLSALAWEAMGFRARAFPLGYVDDFSPYDVAMELGSSSYWSQPPDVRDYRGRVDDPLADRPLDVHANAVLTERRERFFAHNAALFADLRSALFLPTANLPLSARVASTLGVRDATALAQRSQILLNIHRGRIPYFEWHRIVVRGVWQKALVVSEPSLRVPGLVPGEHYVECELREIPNRLRWLLHSAEGRTEAETIRKRAFETLLQRYSLPRIASAFLAEDAPEPGS